MLAWPIWKPQSVWPVSWLETPEFHVEILPVPPCREISSFPLALRVTATLLESYLGLV